jgi:NAD(P)-dependent dehydrogenase (short-subunit alcohol dehydrogenase family)
MAAQAIRCAAMRLEGRIALVTGGASGIGAATARRLAAEGARVAVADVNQAGARSVASEIDGVALRMDVTDVESVRAGVAEAGDVDVLVNNAGTDRFSFFVNTDEQLWDFVLAVNLRGTIAVTHAVLDAMQRRGSGSIVNVASEAGLRGNASGNAYTVSKHGVVGLTKSAAFMYAQQGIRVNAVAPGGVATGIPMPANVSEAGSARLRPFQMAIPTIATAEELAASITFLLSDDAVNINGAILASDGGWSVQ